MHAFVRDAANDPNSLDKRVGLTINKQSAARTGTEHAADLCNVFKKYHKELKCSTVEHQTIFNNVVKRVVHDVLAKSPLELRTSRKGPIIDFLGVLPDVLTKVVQAKGIRKGFVENGMLDKETLSTPVFRKVLLTCRRGFPTELFMLCRAEIVSVAKAMIEKGHVSDQELLAFGFPPDKDMHGKLVVKAAGSENENCQRAKILNHDVQVTLRRNLIEKAAKKENEK
jgi:hypothetical protein